VGTVKSGSTEGKVTATINNKKITGNTSLVFEVKPDLATDTSNPNAKGVAEIVFDLGYVPNTEATLTNFVKITGTTGNAEGVTITSDMKLSTEQTKYVHTEELPTGIYNVTVRGIENSFIFEKKFAVEPGLKTSVVYSRDTTDNYQLTDIGYVGKYILFRSPETFKLVTTSKYWDGTIEYSTDNSSWTAWDGSVINSAKYGDDYYYIFLRGKVNGNSLNTLSPNVNTMGSEYDSTTTRFSIIPTGENTVECYGNLMTLINYETPVTEVAENAFIRLFCNCQSLSTAPDIIATNIGEQAFRGIFWLCESLVKAPSLCAKSVGSSGFSFMFYQSGVVKASKINAETVDKFSFDSMYRNCDKLKIVPDITIKVLPQACCSYMFSECTALETAPGIAADSIFTSTLSDMFFKCTALKTIPYFSVESIGDGGCSQMFYNCSSLESFPTITAKVIEESGCSGMFIGCVNLKISENSGSDDKKIITLPETLSVNAVRDMFKDTGGTFTGTPTAGNTYYYY